MRAFIPVVWERQKFSLFLNLLKKTDASNDRPISLLSDINKLFEQLIYARLYHFIIKNNIPSPHPFGSQRNKSTSDVLMIILMGIIQPALFLCHKGNLPFLTKIISYYQTQYTFINGKSSLPIMVTQYTWCTSRL